MNQRVHSNLRVHPVARSFVTWATVLVAAGLSCANLVADAQSKTRSASSDAAVQITVGQDLSTTTGELLDLTQIGETDWRVWSMDVASNPSYTVPVARKKYASNISNLIVTTKGSVFQNDGWPVFTWAADDEQNGVSSDVSGIDGGFKVYGDPKSTIQFAANNLGESGTLRVYAGAWGCVGTLQARIDDGAPVEQSFSNQEGFGWFDVSYSGLTGPEVIYFTYSTSSGGDMKFWGVALQVESTIDNPQTLSTENFCLHFNIAGPTGKGDPQLGDLLLTNPSCTPITVEFQTKVMTPPADSASVEILNFTSVVFHLTDSSVEILDGNGNNQGSYKVDDLDQWHQWTLVLSNGIVGVETYQYDLYLDGEHLGSGSGAPPDDTPMGVGTGAWFMPDFLLWYHSVYLPAPAVECEYLLDELRVWNGDLSVQGEIQANLFKEVSDFDNLLLYYKFNEGEGATFQPSVGNALTLPGYFIDNVALSWEPRSTSDFHSLTLDPTDQPSVKTLELDSLNQNFTVEFLEKSSSINDGWFIWQESSDVPDGQGLVRIGVQNGKFVFQLSGAGGDDALAVDIPSNYRSGDWNHWACARSNGTRMIYCNGGFCGDDAGGSSDLVPATSGAWYLGTPDSSTKSFSGSIDEVRVWNTARTERQINANMNYMLPHPELDSALLFYGQFDQPDVEQILWTGADGRFQAYGELNHQYQRGDQGLLATLKETLQGYANISVEVQPDSARDALLWTVPALTGSQPALDADYVIQNAPAGGPYTVSVKANGWFLAKPLKSFVLETNSDEVVNVELQNAIVYDFGDVPDMIYNPGGATLAFNVATPPGSTLSLSWDGDAPQGKHTFDTIADGTYSYFTFTPDVDDKSPFSAVITATDEEGKTETDNVSFNPSFVASAESVTINSTGTLPDPTSDFYSASSVEPYINTEAVTFNWVSYPAYATTDSAVSDQGLIDVTISGVDLTLDANSPYISYFCTGENADSNELTADQVNGPINLHSLSICADTITIADYLRCPQTNVTLQARELIFSGADACVDTTPLAPPDQAMSASKDGSTVTPAADGADGMPAGSLTVYAHHVKFDNSEGCVFVATGGKGQMAGDGIDGVPGVSLKWTVTNPALNLPGDDNGNIYDANHGLGEIQDKMDGYQYVYYDEESQAWTPIPLSQTIYLSVAKSPEGGDWSIYYSGYVANNGNSPGPTPTSGGDATAPGQSGAGGAGGACASNLDVRTYFDWSGGDPGDSPPTCQGGAAGTPTLCYICDGMEFVEGSCDYLVINGKDTKFVAPQTNNPITTVAGNSYSAPTPSVSSPGQYTPSSDAFAWLNPLAVQACVAYFQNAMLVGQGSQVLDDMAFYSQTLQDYLATNPGADIPQDSALSDDQNDQLNIVIDLNQCAQLLQQMVSNQRQGLDYFGNPPGWSPLLSFQMNYNLSEQEIDQAVDNLYLCYWIKNCYQELDQKNTALNTAITQTTAQIKQLATRYQSDNDDLGPFSTQLEENSEAITRMQNDIQSLDQQLLKEAENKVDPMWKRVLDGICKGLGAVCDFIPGPESTVAHAALNATDGIVNSINTAGDQNWSDIINGGAGGAADVFKDAASDMNSDAQNSFTTAMLSLQTNSDSAVDEYSDLTSKASKWSSWNGNLKSIGSAVSGIASDIQGVSASDPAVQKEYHNLQLSNSEYQQLHSQVGQLIKQNHELGMKLQKYSQQIMTIPNQTNAMLASVTAMRDSLSANQATLDPRIVSYLNVMEQNALANLLKYKYYLNKSYEYMSLTPATPMPSTEEYYDQLLKIAQQSGNEPLTKDDFENLKPWLKSELTSYASKILDTLQSGDGVEGTYVDYDFKAQGALNAFNDLPDGNILPISLASLIPAKHENARLTDVELVEMTLENGAAATLEFQLIHSDCSTIMKDGQTYFFNHYVPLEEQPLTWTVTWDTSTTLDPASAVSSPDYSSPTYLLKSLTDQGEDTSTFSDPGLMQPWSIIKNVSNQTSTDAPRLKSLTLRFKYQYQDPPENLLYLRVGSYGDITPDFYLNRTDMNGRQDDAGPFTRVFSGDGTVTVTAPGSWNDAPFFSWIKMAEGSPTVSQTNNVIQITNDDYKGQTLTIMADYAAYGVNGKLVCAGVSKLPAMQILLTGTPLDGIPNSYTKVAYNLADGTYAFSDIPVGTYAVTPKADNVDFTPAKLENIVIARGQSPATTTIDDINVEYTGCSISGQVQGATSFTVNAANSQTSVMSSKTISDASTYTLSDLPTGDYVVSIDGADGYTISPESRTASLSLSAPDATGVDFTATALASHTVSGAIENKSIFASKDNLENVMLYLLRGATTVATATSDKHGKFELTGGIYDGQYILVPYKDGSTFSPSSKIVKVNGANASGYKFTVQSGDAYYIAGTVVDENEKPLYGALVSIFLDNAPTATSRATVDANGGYVATVGSQGSYTVQPSYTSEDNTNYKFSPASRTTTISEVFSYRTGLDFVGSPFTADNNFGGSAASDVILKNSKTNTVYAGTGDHTTKTHALVRLASGDGIVPLGSLLAPAGAKSSESEWRRGSMDLIGGGEDWILAGTGNFTRGTTWQSVWRHAVSGVNVLVADSLDAPLPLTTPGKNWSLLGSGDFDGDGKDDLLWLDEDDGDWIVDCSLDGDATPVLREIDPNWSLFDVEDFNSDGRDDLLMTYESDSKRKVRVVLMNGARAVGGGVISADLDDNWSLEACGKFDDDDVCDLVWRQVDDGTIFIDTYPANARVDKARLVFANGDPNVRVAAVGDYDGDGYLDVLLRFEGSRALRVVYMRGDIPRETATVTLTDDSSWSFVNPDHPQ